jgi:hypothetical protein
VKRIIGLAAVLLSGLLSVGAGHAQSGVEKLYILNCGEGVAGDISRWSPGVNEGKSMDFVDNCYLIKHTRGWFLWDTGIPDAVAAMPNGLAPADPKAVTWHRPKTLASQLDQIGVRHHGDGGLAHPSRSHRQCRNVSDHDAVRAEGRI